MSPQQTNTVSAINLALDQIAGIAKHLNLTVRQFVAHPDYLNMVWTVAESMEYTYDGLFNDLVTILDFAYQDA
jgi:uncharacterized iron-regulated membrane protein